MTFTWYTLVYLFTDLDAKSDRKNNIQKRFESRRPTQWIVIEGQLWQRDAPTTSIDLMEYVNITITQ